MEERMSSELGQGIKQSVRFLMQVRQDVLELFSSFESALSERGWQQVMRNAQSSEHPIRFIYRLYGRESEGDELTAALAVYIHLEPPDPLDEPFLMVIGWRFDSPTNCRQIWNSWGGSDALAAELGFRGPVRLSPAQFKSELMPLASGCAVLVLPLTSVSDFDAVVGRVVEPGLEMCAGLAGA
jgi:ASC-1-like (ASCH) protein